MNKIQKSVQHIEQVHKSIYTKTFNKDLMAGKKSILKLNLKQIAEKEKEVKNLKKENNQLRAEIRAYERITKSQNMTKERID